MQIEAQPIHAQRRHELAAYLQACRKRLTPERVGLPSGERRRVKGLRREEVALLAGIGITWYTWLEQGRAIQVSEGMLNRLAQVLHLSEAERVYLFLLAEHNAAPPSLPFKANLVASASDSLQPLLDILEPHPALLRNQYWDVLAWNKAEASVNPWPSMPSERRNMLMYIFTDPYPRQALPQWEEYARNTLRVFRLSSSQFLHDARFAFLVRSLQEMSREFEEWWQEYTVQQQLPAELEWRLPSGKCVKYSIMYLTFPQHPLMVMRLLQPQVRGG